MAGNCWRSKNGSCYFMTIINSILFQTAKLWTLFQTMDSQQVIPTCTNHWYRISLASNHWDRLQVLSSNHLFWFICNCVVVWLVRLHGVVYKFDKVASKTQPNPTQSECLGWCTWLGMIVVKSQSPRLGMTNDKLYLDRPILIPQTLVQFFRFSFHQH